MLDFDLQQVPPPKKKDKVFLPQRKSDSIRQKQKTRIRHGDLLKTLRSFGNISHAQRGQKPKGRIKTSIKLSNLSKEILSFVSQIGLRKPEFPHSHLAVSVTIDQTILVCSSTQRFPEIALLNLLQIQTHDRAPEFSRAIQRSHRDTWSICIDLNSSAVRIRRMPSVVYRSLTKQE